jgi:hypothetical protein
VDTEGNHFSPVDSAFAVATPYRLHHAVETGSRAIDQWEVNRCARLDDLSRSRATGRASLKGLLDVIHRL